MQNKKVYQQLASAMDALKRCESPSANESQREWRDKWGEQIMQIVGDFLPHGSGIDNGVTFDFDLSTGEKLVLHTSYHHMNDGGYYDGWTEHTITVRPSLCFGINISISGRNRNEIKDYLTETFEYALTREIVWDNAKEGYTRGLDAFADVPDLGTLHKLLRQRE